MGADLLIEHLWIVRGREPDWNAARQAIYSMTELDAVGWHEAAQRDFDVPSGLEGVQSQLLADTDAIEAKWSDQCHDVVKCDLGPVVALMTGGMSYGDDPTDCWDLFERFVESPAAKAAGFFVDPYSVRNGLEEVVAPS
jgi:hypothetical protein